jgi:putative transposase
MVYIDLNMVRASAVVHPSEWPFCGYHEIQNPRLRYSLIDHSSLIDLFNMGSMDELSKTYRDWVEEALERKDRERQPQWTESIAIGADEFYELREPETSYKADFGLENAGLSQQNSYFWDLSV